MKIHLNKNHQLRLSHLISHKLLHKIGKQWIIISLSTFFLLTGVTAINGRAEQVPTKLEMGQPVQVTKQANLMHKKLLNHAIVTVDSRSAPRQNFVKSHFRRTRSRWLLRRSGYSVMPGYKNAFSNYYAPNDRRAYIPSNYRLRYNTSWVRGTSYQINKYPTAVNLYTYKRNKWLVSDGKPIRRRSRRRVFRKSSIKRGGVKKRFRRKRVVKRRIRRRAHRTYRRKITRNYLLADKSNDSHFITNNGMKALENNDLSDYDGDFYSDINSDNPPVNIVGRKSLAGYNFDDVKGHEDQYPFKAWVFADEISTRHNRTYYANHINALKKAIETSFSDHYFTSDEQAKINNIRNQYRYLMNNEDSSDYSNQAAFRQHEVDWANFYRTVLYNLRPVSENANYDEQAQEGADNDQDPEDMSFSTDDPHSPIQGFFTDEHDLDGTSESGHRDSLLNPLASQMGVGQYNGNTSRNAAFFDWGLDNNDRNGIPASVAFPNAGLFPLSDAAGALDGSSWSYEFATHPYAMNDGDYDPGVSVYDDTANSNVLVSNVHPMEDEVYYRVGPKDIKNGHQYTVTIINLPTGNVRYSFKLFKLEP